MKDELRVYSFGEILGKCFTLTLSSIFQYALVMLIAFFPLAIFILFLIPDFWTTIGFNHPLISSSYTNDKDNEILFTIIFLVYFLFAFVFITLYMTKVIANKLLGDQASIKSLIASSFKSLFPATLLFGLENFLIMLSSLPAFIIATMLIDNLPAISMLLFLVALIPGIYVFLGLSVSIQAFIFDKSGIWGSITRSWRLTKENRIQVFALNFIMYVIYTVITFGFITAITIIAFTLPDLAIYFGTILIFLIYLIIIPMFISLHVLIYFNLKVKKEHYNMERLVEQFSLDSL